MQSLTFKNTYFKQAKCYLLKFDPNTSTSACSHRFAEAFHLEMMEKDRKKPGMNMKGESPAIGSSLNTGKTAAHTKQCEYKMKTKNLEVIDAKSIVFNCGLQIRDKLEAAT